MARRKRPVPVNWDQLISLVEKLQPSFRLKKEFWAYVQDRADLTDNEVLAVRDKARSRPYPEQDSVDRLLELLVNLRSDITVKDPIKRLHSELPQTSALPQTNSFDVVAISHANIDLIHLVDAVGAGPDHDGIIESVDRSFGGAGINTMSALAMFGRRCAVVASVGGR